MVSPLMMAFSRRWLIMSPYLRIGEVRGIGFKPKTKVWARLGADFRKRLEAANAAVEETGRLSVQFPAQLAEPFR